MHEDRAARVQESSMAGVMRKTMVYLGLADSDEQFEAEPQNARTEHVRTEEDKPAPST